MIFKISLKKVFRFLCYNIRKSKTSGCEADIWFACDINEQTSDKIGQKARKREFASLKDLINAKAKQAAAKQTFDFRTFKATLNH